MPGDARVAGSNAFRFYPKTRTQRRWFDGRRETRGTIAGNKAALQFIDEAVANGDVPTDVAERLRAEYDERMQQLRVCAENNGNRSGEIVTRHYRQLQQSALAVERRTIIHLRNEHVINDEAIRRIQRDLDLAEARLSGS